MRLCHIVGHHVTGDDYRHDVRSPARSLLRTVWPDGGEERTRLDGKWAKDQAQNVSRERLEDSADFL